MARRFKNWCIYVAVLGLLRVLGTCPDRLRRTWARFIGGVAFAVAHADRRRIDVHLGAAYGDRMTTWRRRVVARGVFDHLAASILELAAMLRLGTVPEQIELPANSARALDGALRQGRGVIFVTGHLGNWELMAAALAARGYPIWTVAKESYDPRFTAILERERGRFGVRSVFRGRPGAAAAMLRVLRAGDVLGILIDQDTKVPGVFVPFFGRRAHTPVAAAVLARRTGAALVVGGVRRGRSGVHRIEVEAVPGAADDLQVTAELTRAIEQRVRRRPSQWVWMHRRWKTRPGEECHD